MEEFDKFKIGDKVSHKKFGTGTVKGIHRFAIHENSYDVRFPFPVGYEYEIAESDLNPVE